MESMSQAFDQMKMVKDVMANSDRVSELLKESTHQINLLTSPNFLPKVKDQGKFTLPCTLGHLKLDNALVDSGASDVRIRSSPFLSLILQVHRSEVVNGYRTQGPDCTLQVMSLRTS
ncbi:unnamed protein product [Microthlaspi erraticum]|uniref:Aspartic peptidase DDI1-type domain-containing protein n=1 Tax=Microthlaspi erraticum TaxID=1685480 RepID=A0A6D2HPX0_9BRAS|nr:unnamed protein product [Microthlaspi erraticum]